MIREYSSGSVDTRCMPVSDRTHLENLAFDELHPIAFTQNTRFDHTVVLVHRKQPSGHFDLHETKHIAPLT
jgi:hypothetical protein